MAKIQVQGYLQLLAAAYLFGVSLRGPRDYRIAGRLIVAAACIKAAMAVWIRFTLPSSYLTSDGVMTEMHMRPATGTPCCSPARSSCSSSHCSTDPGPGNCGGCY